MPTYQVTAPDGRSLRLTGDSPPNEQELEQIFSSMEPQAAPQQVGDTITSPIGQSDPDIPQVDEQGIPITETYDFSAPAPTFGERVTGLLEAGKTIATGATGGTLGAVVGTLKGLGDIIASGEYGTQEGAEKVAKLQQQYAASLTDMPETEEGQRYVKAVGDLFGALPPVVGAGGAGAFSAATSAPLKVSARSASENIATALNKSSMPSLSKAESGFRKGDLSVGAAQTPKELERATVASQMPIPFQEGSALTKGQVSRNFEQLQFEKEIAKQEIGAPIRERTSNQTNTLIQNLDAISDLSEPMAFELRDIGRGVDSALRSRHASQKARERALYRQASNAGQMREQVEISQMPSVMEALDEMQDVASNAVAIRRAALRRGIVSEADGAISPAKRSLEEIERFRQVVNNLTDISDPRESRVRRIVLSAIDDATENAGGDVYQRARRFSGQMRQEFENVGLTKKLLDTKGKTSERAIAYEDVFKKIMLDSPIEEVNKLRGTLLRAGDQGKQAWADLKAKGIDYIRERSQSMSQSDEFGVPILSPDKMNRAIKSLDDQGKLDAIYGRRNAQVIRDLGDLANVIFTAPPGAVNYSNTASALQVALDSLGGFAVTGIPAPMVTTLKEGAKLVKNQNTRRKINSSLNYLENQSRSQ